MWIRAEAKVNLALTVQAPDETGLHPVESVIARIGNLYDIVHIRKARTLQLRCSERIPLKRNLAYRAVRTLEHQSGRSLPCDISIYKRIPIASGLGGGSSDAAAVLIWLNSNYRLGLTSIQLAEIGADVGMDVPFFVLGCEVAHVTGYGETVHPLPDLPDSLTMKVVSVGSPQPTSHAYQQLDRCHSRPRTSPKSVMEAVVSRDADGILQSMYNDFEWIYNRDGPRPGEILAGSGKARIRIISTSPR